MAIKNPASVSGCGVFGIFACVARRALTRTSVGNEKYEYKDEKRNRARIGNPRNQRKLVVQGRDAGGAAVRHNPDPSERGGGMSTIF
jgi:hypothetical protein